MTDSLPPYTETHGMKVKHLIEELQALPAEAEVHIQYNSGDYWRTQVAPRVDSIQVGLVKYSEYHRMATVVEDMDDDDTEKPESVINEVVLIG